MVVTGGVRPHQLLDLGVPLVIDHVTCHGRGQRFLIAICLAV